MLRHITNPSIFRNILLQPYSGIFRTLQITDSSIFRTQANLRTLCFMHIHNVRHTEAYLSTLGIFRQIQVYSGSWNSYSMEPTLARHPCSRYSRKHATHASTNSTPFFKLPKEMKKSYGGIPIYEEYEGLPNNFCHCF